MSIIPGLNLNLCVCLTDASVLPWVESPIWWRRRQFEPGGRLLETEGDTFWIVSGRRMAACQGGSVMRRYVGQSDVGANTEQVSLEIRRWAAAEMAQKAIGPWRVRSQCLEPMRSLFLNSHWPWQWLPKRVRCLAVERFEWWHPVKGGSFQEDQWLWVRLNSFLRNCSMEFHNWASR